VGGDRRWNKSIRSSSVFVKDHASAKCTDTEEAGRGEVRAKIEEVIAHPLMCLLALGVEAQGRWRVDLDKEHRMPVERHGDRRMNVVCIIGTLVKVPDGVEPASDTKKFVQECNVGYVVGGSELRPVEALEWSSQIWMPKSSRVVCLCVWLTGVEAEGPWWSKVGALTLITGDIVGDTEGGDVSRQKKISHPLKPSSCHGGVVCGDVWSALNESVAQWRLKVELEWT